jgi:hypothetical protein
MSARAFQQLLGQDALAALVKVEQGLGRLRRHREVPGTRSTAPGRPAGASGHAPACPRAGRTGQVPGHRQRGMAHDQLDHGWVPPAGRDRVGHVHSHVEQHSTRGRGAGPCTPSGDERSLQCDLEHGLRHHGIPQPERRQDAGVGRTHGPCLRDPRCGHARQLGRCRRRPDGGLQRPVGTDPIKGRSTLESGQEKFLLVEGQHPDTRLQCLRQSDRDGDQGRDGCPAGDPGDDYQCDHGRCQGRCRGLASGDPGTGQCPGSGAGRCREDRQSSAGPVASGRPGSSGDWGSWTSDAWRPGHDSRHVRPGGGSTKKGSGPQAGSGGTPGHGGSLPGRPWGSWERRSRHGPAGSPGRHAGRWRGCWGPSWRRWRWWRVRRPSARRWPVAAWEVSVPRWVRIP